MKVNVKVFASLREALGRSEMEVEFPEKGEATLDELLERLSRISRKLGKELSLWRGGLETNIIVMVNGKTVRGVNVKLQDGDLIVFMPPVAGG